MTDKNCSTCKYEPRWYVVSAPEHEGEVKRGFCRFPFPPGLPVGLNKPNIELAKNGFSFLFCGVYPYEFTDCPAWAEKEAPQ